MLARISGASGPIVRTPGGLMVGLAGSINIGQVQPRPSVTERWLASTPVTISVNPATCSALGTRNGGEPINGDY